MSADERAAGSVPPPGSDDDPDRVVIRDKRRVSDAASGTASGSDGAMSGDPIEGAAGETPDPDAAPDDASVDPVVGDLQKQVAERTADLQRLQAEYANYRKRVDRDRMATAEAATGAVVSAFLPILDDIDRARAHDDLTGALKSIAEQVESSLAKFGLEGFGEAGDPFDPTVHEAVTHGQSDEVEVATCTLIMRRGYRLGERLLRPAMVGVSDPA